MELSVVPVFQSEIVPTRVRGLIVGTYQFSLIVSPTLINSDFGLTLSELGGIVINSICRGTSTMTDNRAWRIPLGCFYIIPSIVLSLIWFIPEVSVSRSIVL
jgi:SP family sugar:H+ symporter-like MFS transporter